MEEEAVASLHQDAETRRSVGTAAPEEGTGNSTETDNVGFSQEVYNDNTEDEPVEHDGVFVFNFCLSVRTVIKRKAMKIHQQYAESLEKCSVDDRKIMINGLSSILDLCDLSVNSQQRPFNVKQWNELSELFSFQR